MLAGLAVGCEAPPAAFLVLPAGLALDELSDEQQKLLRVTLEISDQARAETDVVLNLSDLSLSADLTLDNVGTGGERTATLRVYGRAVVAADAPPAVEVLLGDTTDTVTLTPKGVANLDFAGAVFETCHAGIDGACSLAQDQNRNGNDNITDLIAQIDPAPQAPFSAANPQTLQFASGIRLGSFQRQVVVVENQGEHVIRLRSVRVAGGQGVGVSLFDPSAPLVAPPRRSIDGDALDLDGIPGSDFEIAPGADAFVAVSFAPVNSFLTTAIVQIVAVDDVTGVAQGVRTKVIANADGSPRPPNPNYVAPLLPAEITLGTGAVPVLAFPTAELFSGAEVSIFGVDGTTPAGLKAIGSTIENLPADAAFAAVIQPKHRFTAALANLASDLDLTIIELEDDDNDAATPPTFKSLLGKSTEAGTSAEAVEVVNEGTSDQLVLVVLGRIDVEGPPAGVQGALLATERAPFRLSCQTSRGPEIDDDAPIAPTTGTLDGGITVVLKGTGFFVAAPGEPSVRVTFNGQPSVGVPRITVDADGKQLISAVLPPGGTAVADIPTTVVVENPLLASALERGADGQAVSLPDGFRYDLPTPRLLSMSPDVATVDGGTLELAVGGAFFSDKYGPPQVFFDDIAVDATFIDSARISVRPPPHAAGVASVSVRSIVFGGGLGEPSGQRAFLFVQPTLPVPTLTSMTPNSADAVGGQQAQIVGTNFDPAVRVFLGSAEASVVAVTDTLLDVIIPSSTIAGAVAVLVLNPDGQPAAVAVDGNGVPIPVTFTYTLSPPVITRVFPDRAIVAGNAQTVVDGSGFAADVRVTFVTPSQNVEASFVSRRSSTSLLVTTPAFDAEAVGTIVVANGDGQSASAPFTVFAPAGAAPRIVSLDPNSGSVDGGTEVTLLGSNFLEPVVLVGGTQVTDVNGPNDAGNGLSSLRFVMPAKAAGTQQVSVFNSDGQGITTSFSYLDIGQARIVGLRPAVVHASVSGDEILVFGDDLGLLGTPVTATADLGPGLGSTPIDVAFVSDSFASLFIRQALPAGTFFVTLIGPEGTVRASFSIRAQQPDIERVQKLDKEGDALTLVGIGLAGDRLSAVDIGGAVCALLVADERIITCRLLSEPSSDSPSISLFYGSDGDPVVDSVFIIIGGCGDQECNNGESPSSCPSDCQGGDGPCSTITGSVAIRSTEDLQAMENVCAVTGSVEVEVPGLTNLSFPALVTVGRGLNIAGASSGTSTLTTISLPVLENVDGDVFISGSNLTTVVLPALANVGGTVDISGHQSLPTLSLPGLASAGSVNIRNNVALTSILLPVLVSLEANFSIGQNFALTSLLVSPTLVNVGGSVDISNNFALTSIEFPGLASVGQGVDIQGNAALQSIAFPVLDAVGFINISNNPALTQCEGDSIFGVGDCANGGEGEGEGEPPPPFCGDGFCNNGENNFQCSLDCPEVCGDGVCGDGERALGSCPADCDGAPVCDDGVCNNGETSASCPADCIAIPEVCGDGVCSDGERAFDSLCSSDCCPNFPLTSAPDGFTVGQGGGTFSNNGYTPNGRLNAMLSVPLTLPVHVEVDLVFNTDDIALVGTRFDGNFFDDTFGLEPAELPILRFQNIGTNDFVQLTQRTNGTFDPSVSQPFPTAIEPGIRYHLSFDDDGISVGVVVKRLDTNDELRLAIEASVNSGNRLVLSAVDTTFSNLTMCSSVFGGATPPFCGDGNTDTELGETCDQGTPETPADGCSSNCQVTGGFECTGVPSVCTPICGDNFCDANNGENTLSCQTDCPPPP